MKPSPGKRRLAMVVLAAWTAGCSRGSGPEAPDPPARLAVRVVADSGRLERLAVRPPAAEVWVEQVSPSRDALPQPPVPEPAPDSSIPELPPREPAVPAGLKPPVLMTPGLLRVPAGVPAGGAVVELDVRVEESGAVGAALWAGGSRDSALVASAVACARGMRFLPALRGGREVTVWCRQRFVFEPR